MDETDLFKIGKKTSKHDKADATSTCTVANSHLVSAKSEPKRVIVSRPTAENTYRDCPNVGIALILNHKDVKGQKQRVGTERDRDDIVRTLNVYGFEVRVFNDLTFAELSEQLKLVAAEDHSRNDCFLLVVMSHGTEGKVYAKDMSYPVERLWNPFLGDSCKSLINKPKLFFIQACRGDSLEKAVTFSEFSPMSRELNIPASYDEQPEIITYAIPNTADMLVMYSTFEKYYSFRNVEYGSWFIQSLCKVLDDVAENEAAAAQGAELLSLLTAVNRVVAYEYQSNAKNEAYNQMKEMPNFLSTLTKSFFLRVKRNN